MTCALQKTGYETRKLRMYMDTIHAHTCHIYLIFLNFNASRAERAIFLAIIDVFLIQCIARGAREKKFWGHFLKSLQIACQSLAKI